jgi:hypothetical protein
VFINYRTGDEEATATLIEQDLSRRFGSDQVFRASKSIRPGDDFSREILAAVRRSHVLLAVIGPGWLDALDGSGGRALDQEGDWVRREICEAFDCDVRVIPVLVGSTGRLNSSALPSCLQPLANCQYIRFSHRNADADLDLLATKLANLVPGLTRLDIKDRGAPRESSSVTNQFYAPVDATGANFGIIYGRPSADN